MKNNIAQIDTLNQLNKKSCDLFYNYGRMIEDLKNIIEVKKLLVNNDDSRNINDIQKIYDNYIGNSFDIFPKKSK